MWELMNSRAPIPGFDRPSQTRRATWASWAVSAWLASTAAWAVRLRAVSPLATSSRRARSANTATPIASSMTWAVLAAPSLRAAAPLPAKQPTSGSPATESVAGAT